MNKFIFLALLALVATKNVILIGDSRYVGMANYLMGFSYTTITPSGGTGTNICSTSARSFDGHSIQVTAQVGASSYTFKSGSQIYNSVHSQLKKASPGSIVLLWLGINDTDAVQSTFDFYSNLAKTYSTLTFKAISITGVNEQKTWLRNASAKSFNSKLSAKINSAGISNLKYVSILNGDNVNSIIAGGKKISIVNYMAGDGLHYTKDGYSYLWKAMAGKL